MQSRSKGDVFHQRRPASEVTPVEEDAGLFKTALCDMMVELIPQTRRNDRDDLIIRGFVDRKTEVDIFFAGRRTALVAPLETQLKALLAHARKLAAERNGPPPDIEKIRLPVRVQGAWRRSRVRDENGWETGTYHFVVARWSLLDREGSTVTFGEPPLVYRPSI
jgi:hypothetical protein